MICSKEFAENREFASVDLNHVQGFDLGKDEFALLAGTVIVDATA